MNSETCRGCQRRSVSGKLLLHAHTATQLHNHTATLDTQPPTTHTHTLDQTAASECSAACLASVTIC